MSARSAQAEAERVILSLQDRFRVRGGRPQWKAMMFMSLLVNVTVYTCSLSLTRTHTHTHTHTHTSSHTTHITTTFATYHLFVACLLRILKVRCARHGSMMAPSLGTCVGARADTARTLHLRRPHISFSHALFVVFYTQEPQHRGYIRHEQTGIVAYAGARPMQTYL